MLTVALQLPVPRRDLHPHAVPLFERYAKGGEEPVLKGLGGKDLAHCG